MQCSELKFWYEFNNNDAHMTKSYVGNRLSGNPEDLIGTEALVQVIYSFETEDGTYKKISSQLIGSRFNTKGEAEYYSIASRVNYQLAA